MGVKISKHYSSNSYYSFSSKLFFYVFSLTVLAKLAYRNFEISIFFLNIEIFLSMGPYGSEHFKTLLLPQF